MKVLVKVALVATVVGVGGATMWAAPGGERLVGEAGVIHDKIVEEYRHVEHLRTVARREKDVIKLNCVNDKLVQMKAEMNVVDRAFGVLQGDRSEAAARGPFDIIVSTSQSVHSLREAAEQCMGISTLSSESSTAFTHPAFPDNPNNNPWGGSTIEPPAYASPFN